MTIADAGLSYIARPGGVQSYDLWRLDQINRVVGDFDAPKLPRGEKVVWAKCNRNECERKIYAQQRFRYGTRNLDKVGVEGSNPFARSRILDLIEGSPVTSLRAGRPQCRAGSMP